MNNEFDNSSYDEPNYNNKPIITWRFIAGVIVAIVAIVLVRKTGSFINSCKDTYNELVTLQENVNQAKSDVEAAMQRRAELIPDMVETLKASDKHDEQLYAELSSASENLLNILGSDPEEVSDANYELSLAINRMIVLVRQYPDIIDKEKYSKFMVQLEGSVNRILASRSNYNEMVGIYNTKVRQYPGIIIAKIFGFDVAEYFKADDAAKKELNVVNFD